MIGYILSLSTNTDWVDTLKSRLPTWSLFEIKLRTDNEDMVCVFGIPKEKLDEAFKENCSGYSDIYDSKWVAKNIKHFWTMYLKQLEAAKCIPIDKGRVQFICMPKGTKIL